MLSPSTSSKPSPTRLICHHTISEQQPLIFSPSAAFVATSDVVLSLPNQRQLEAGEFNLDELVKELTELLAEDSQRNEILELTGDTAVLVIECLDKVSETEPGFLDVKSSSLSRSYRPMPSGPFQISKHALRCSPRSQDSLAAFNISLALIGSIRAR